jgi:hypothetical protein
MKGYLRKILCIFLCFCIFSSCGKEAEENSPGQQKENWEEGNSEEILDNKNPEDSEDVSNSKDPKDSEGISDSENSKESLGNGKDLEENLDDLEKNVPTKTLDEEELIFPLLENYRERGIELDPTIDGKGESYAGILLNAKNKIEYYVSTRKENGYFLFCYTLNDETLTWDRKAVTWSKGLGDKVQNGRITVFLGEDGYYYAWYADEEQLYHFIRAKEDTYQEIVIPDWDKTEERDYRMIPGKVGVFANGNIVMAHQGKECTIYNGEDGSVLDRFRCGWYESMCVGGNDLYMLSPDTTNVTHYDGENLRALPPIEGNFRALLRMDVRGDEIIASSPEGIFLAKKSGGKFQKVLDSGKFYFSKESGNPLILLAAGEAFYIAYGESGLSLKKYAQRNPNDEFLGELTVYSLENSDLILNIVSQFQTKHPEMDVFYETGDGAEGSTTAADRIRALNARILAGDGPDILVLDGLPADSYKEKGILADMSEALAPVKEELLGNILAIYGKEGIYMLPFCIQIPMFGVCGSAEEAYGSLTELADYWEKGQERAAAFAALPYAYHLALMYYNFQPEFALPGGSVKKEEITEFLENVKRVYDAAQTSSVGFDEEYADQMYEFYGQKGIKDYFRGVNMGEFEYRDGKSNFLFYNIDGIHGLSTAPYIIKQRDGRLVSNSSKFFPNGIFAINTKTKKKALAESFIKEIFSAEIQDKAAFFEGFPLNEKVLSEDEKMDYSYITSSNGDFTAHWFNAQEAEEMMGVVRSVSIPVEKNQMIFEIVIEEGCAFLAGEKSLDAAAEGIANRVGIYYLEQQ